MNIGGTVGGGGGGVIAASFLRFLLFPFPKKRRKKRGWSLPSPLASLFCAANSFRVTWPKRRSEAFPARSPRIRHRSELSQKASENAVRGLDKVEATVTWGLSRRHSRLPELLVAMTRRGPSRHWCAIYKLLNTLILITLHRGVILRRPHVRPINGFWFNASLQQ